MARGAKVYAWACEGDTGIEDSWAACEARVLGRNARYRGFTDRAEARAWLDAGAQYESRSSRKAAARQELPEDAIYFDAGTGRGAGTEVNVTDRQGVPMVHLAQPRFPITEFGTVRLPPGKTNNFGELLGCFYALRIARTTGRRRVCGDSELVISWWSRDRISAEKRESDPDLVLLAAHTARERRAFEAEGGSLQHVSGSVNPADLGFHRD